MTFSDPKELASRVGELRAQVLTAVGEVVVGLEPVTLQLLTALLAGGHALLEGVPGTAKTTLCRTFSQVLGIDYQRVQFTPDLLPTDVVGTQILDRQTEEIARSIRRPPRRRRAGDRRIFRHTQEAEQQHRHVVHR